MLTVGMFARVAFLLTVLSASAAPAAPVQEISCVKPSTAAFQRVCGSFPPSPYAMWQAIEAANPNPCTGDCDNNQNGFRLELRRYPLENESFLFEVCGQELAPHEATECRYYHLHRTATGIIAALPDKETYDRDSKKISRIGQYFRESAYDPATRTLTMEQNGMPGERRRWKWQGDYFKLIEVTDLGETEQVIYEAKP